MREERVGLKDHAESREPRVKGSDIALIEFNFARVGFFQSRQSCGELSSCRNPMDQASRRTSPRSISREMSLTTAVESKRFGRCFEE